MSNVTAQVPDASINAYFKAQDYNAKLATILSCVDSKPTGNFNMSTSGKEIWRISSNMPIEINTEANNLSDHIHCAFANTTVKNETSGRKFTNCTAFLDAVEWPLGGGVKGINVTFIVLQTSSTRPVFEWDGIFLGKMKVAREVTCGTD